MQDSGEAEALATYQWIDVSGARGYQGVDHVVPRSKGGTDHKSNLWLLCGHCNSVKGTKSQAEFLRDRMRLQGINAAWLDRHGPPWEEGMVL